MLLRDELQNMHPKTAPQRPGGDTNVQFDSEEMRTMFMRFVQLYSQNPEFLKTIENQNYAQGQQISVPQGYFSECSDDHLSHGSSFMIMSAPDELTKSNWSVDDTMNNIVSDDIKSRHAMSMNKWNSQPHQNQVPQLGQNRLPISSHHEHFNNQHKNRMSKPVGSLGSSNNKYEPHHFKNVEKILEDDSPMMRNDYRSNGSESTSNKQSGSKPAKAYQKLPPRQYETVPAPRRTEIANKSKNDLPDDDQDLTEIFGVSEDASLFTAIHRRNPKPVIHAPIQSEVRNSDENDVFMGFKLVSEASMPKKAAQIEADPQPVPSPSKAQKANHSSDKIFGGIFGSAFTGRKK